MAGTVGRLMIMACAAGALAACVPGKGTSTSEAAASDAAPAATPGKAATSVKLVDRDVEAPEIFQTTDMALWDGRPSLGGVWVASPDAKDPERVILRNSANGKFVIGALFRRERENPGPKLQISSDAAAALGLLAGQPGKINVTALRREEAPAQTDASKPLLDAAETVAPEGAAVAKDAKAALAKPAAPVIGGAPIPGGTIAAQPVKPGAAAPAPAKTAAKPAQPAAKPAASGGAHVAQIGIFSVEANAKRAADQLGKAGIAATIKKGQTQGKDHWSVTASGADKAALLAKVKSLGFTDAYIIK
ncbi:SPOR domain-containing protein [Gemmobacter caeruleus]|uniref:SPOR domain-containing protein n=1 Tax=Gemmobacter caeruleus TaxID=2595004 RepID=UPI001EF052F5|nr:SPOR domain-containing protein [Gemmobacter caeruleus]